MGTTPIKAITLANTFIQINDDDTGEYVSNLKIQKLLYYSQGFHLAIYGTPLFEEQITAWQHGPVVIPVYEVFKNNGAAPIIAPTDEIDIEKTFHSNQIDLIMDVNQVYGQFSAWKLRNMTHNESPWNETPIHGEITHEKLIAYFKTQINE